MAQPPARSRRHGPRPRLRSGPVPWRSRGRSASARRAARTHEGGHPGARARRLRPWGARGTYGGWYPVPGPGSPPQSCFGLSIGSHFSLRWLMSKKEPHPFYFVPPPSLPSRAARGAPAVRPSSPTCASLTRPLSAFQRGDGPGHGDLRNGRRARPLRPARRLAPVERWRVGRGLFNDGRMFVSRQQNNTNKTMHNKQHTTDAGSRESAGRAPRARRRQHPAG
jgi:hypothetical protein